MYNIFYDFYCNSVFSDATIRDRDIILHYSSLISCILVLLAIGVLIALITTKLVQVVINVSGALCRWLQHALIDDDDSK